ncbi:hypothetical protein JHD48_07730, partial [Sulfurimonas sp. SAG-AH-194-I05]
MNHKFNSDLYPKHISYTSPFSAYQFFSNIEQTTGFLKFLAYRLIEEEDKRKEEYSFKKLALIDNNYASVLNIEYRFFILVLSEWIEHYCVDETCSFTYKKFKTF